MMRRVTAGEDMEKAASICGKERRLLKRKGRKIGGREYVISPLAGLSLNLGASGIIELSTRRLRTEDEERKTSSEKLT